MQRVVINRCFGGFGLSPEATLWLFHHGYDEKEFKTPVKEYFRDTYDYPILTLENRLDRWRQYLKGDRISSIFLSVFTPDEKYVLYTRDIERNHPLLLKCLEELGQDASGDCADLKIVEIPDDVQYVIEEYDGNEHIAEAHRTWP